MLCIRPAIEGGFSGYAGSHHYNVMNDPTCCRISTTSCMSPVWRAAGRTDWCAQRIPIFSITDGVPSVIFIRGYINLAVDEGHVECRRASVRHSTSWKNIEPAGCAPRLYDGAWRSDVCEQLSDPAYPDRLRNSMTLHCDGTCRLWPREDDRPAAAGVLLHKGKAGIEKRWARAPIITTMRWQCVQ